MRKYLWIIGFLFVALPAAAAEPIYVSVAGVFNNTIVLTYKTLSEQEHAACDLSTFKCVAVKDTAAYIEKNVPKDTTPAPTPFYRPGGAQVTRSADGRFIAWYEPAAGTKTTRRYGLHDTTTGKDYTFNTPSLYWDLISEEFRVFSFSPDSKRLLYLDDRDGFPTVYQVDLTKPLSDAAFKGTKVISRQYSVSDFLFLTSNTIAFTANRENPLTWGLYEYNLDTGALKQLATNITYTGRLRLIAGKLLFYQQSGNLIDLRSYDLTSKTVQPLPVKLEKLKPVATTPPGEIVNLRGIWGVVSKPATTGAYPMIVWLHGGPYRQTNVGYHPYSSYGSYDWLLESLRAQGFGIAKLDYAGSYGYGRAYAESIKGQVGIKDVDTVAIAVAELKKRYPTSQVYLMGNSYGGYLALKTLTDYPKSFRGAISIAGVTDWQALHEKLPQSIFTIHFNGTPKASNKSLYAQASVISNLKKLTNQKILLLHGQMDGTIPVDQADLLYRQAPDSLINFVAYAEEDHVFKQQKTLEDMCKQILTLAGKGLAGSCLK